MIQHKEASVMFTMMSLMFSVVPVIYFNFVIADSNYSWVTIVLASIILTLVGNLMAILCCGLIIGEVSVVKTIKVMCMQMMCLYIATMTLIHGKELNDFVLKTLDI